MLLTKKVEVGLGGKNAKYYENLGYEIPRYKDKKGRLSIKRGTTILVNIEDLPENSNSMVNVQCDYCLEKNIVTIKSKRYCTYIVSHKYSQKDSCPKHSGLKGRESFLNIYGYINPSQTDKHKIKYKETCQEKYGADNTFQVEEFKDKAKETCLLKFGTEYAMQNDIIKEKAIKTLYQNNTAPCSAQQKYIQKLIGGELNYPVSTLNLDIAFIDEKIYVEYDGGGHLLSINLGNQTIKEFNDKSRKRWYYLKSKGWRSIKIISRKDLFPANEKFLEIIKYAKEYLNAGHSWIKFDVDNSKIINSQGEFDYNFGELYLLYKKKCERIMEEMKQK